MAINKTQLIIPPEIAIKIVIDEMGTIDAKTIQSILDSDETVVRHELGLDATFLDVISLDKPIMGFTLNKYSLSEIKGMI